jgi:hypothetical protein
MKTTILIKAIRNLTIRKMLKSFVLPGSAGKSSLDMVNSLVSIAGCFTIPTEKKVENFIKLIFPILLG